MNQPSKTFARLSSEQWQNIINEQLESGMSQKDFCQSQNISIATFFNGKHKFGGCSPAHQPPSSPKDQRVDSTNLERQIRRQSVKV